MRLACVFLVLAPARRVEPFPLLCQAFAQRDPGFPSEAFAGEVDRGAGVAGVAPGRGEGFSPRPYPAPPFPRRGRSEEDTPALQPHLNILFRLLLRKKKKRNGPSRN